MKIINIKVMRGPNFWSVDYEKLIVIKLDLEELEDRPTDEIDGFLSRIKNLFPSMIHHHCSEGHEGGFFERIRRGTWMGHVIEHIALELQNIAGMDCGFGRTRGTDKDGVYTIAFEYKYEEAGKFAANQAVKIAEALVKGITYDLTEDIKQLKQLHQRWYLGLSTGSVVEEALKRNIPYIETEDYIMFGYGCRQKRIQATIASTTSYVAVDICGDKDGTKKLLKSFSIPIPEGVIISSEIELKDAIDQVEFPLVVKPRDGNHGRGITTDINTFEDAVAAFAIAQRVSKKIIIEKFIKGYDYRLLVIDYKFVGAIKRVPAYITGDGKSTIEQLIDVINREPRREKKPGNILEKIKIDEGTLNILKRNELTLNSVLEKDKVLIVKDVANVSSAGVPIDETDNIHPYNIFQAERIARIIGLDICGIDVISPDLSEPMNKKSAVVEVNAAPGIRMHIEPAEGKSRNVAGAIVDMLFPKGANPTIPIVAVTGTNGKTTITRLIAHIAKVNGIKTGYSNTDGIYIDEIQMEKGDCSGPDSARYVLKDPTVEFAILECARGGILRSGLGFSRCDVGIITNVKEDHLGLENINTLEDLAKVKSVVAETIKFNGYAILNADDENVYNIQDNLLCNIALFSIDSNNSKIQQHIQKGRLAAILEGDHIILYERNKATKIANVKEIPLTFSGTAVFMIQNILPAIITAYVNDISIDKIKEGLKTFIPGIKHTPGRMNLFDFKNFQVLVDYAHNPAGLEAIGDYLLKKDNYKIGIITGVGDRRDKDIVAIGKIAAKIFDEVIIKTDEDLRGRKEEELIDLLINGIEQGDKKVNYRVIKNEADAIEYAVTHAPKKAMIVILAEKVSQTIETVNNLQEKDLVHERQ